MTDSQESSGGFIGVNGFSVVMGRVIPVVRLGDAATGLSAGSLVTGSDGVLSMGMAGTSRSFSDDGARMSLCVSCQRCRLL